MKDAFDGMVSNLVCKRDHVMFVSMCLTDLKYYIFKNASIRQ